MNTSKKLLKSATRPDWLHSFIFYSEINATTQNPSILLKVLPKQTFHSLLQEIRIPLNHINLSVEMIETIVNENELNICVEVISRNTTRINNLVNIFINRNRRQ